MSLPSLLLRAPWYRRLHDGVQSRIAKKISRLLSDPKRRCLKPKLLEDLLDDMTNSELFAASFERFVELLRAA